MKDARKYFEKLKKFLAPHHVHLSFNKGFTEFSTAQKSVRLEIPFDLAFHKAEQLSSIILSRLSLNQKIFARNCEVKKIDKKTAENFINRFHLMGATSSAWNYGLFHKDELLAVASFSKGRRMRRLPADQRSFELIRFCTKHGITVTGGLSKLVKHFCRERKAGDVMTYIDKQFSEGIAFKKAGFITVHETPPHYFLIDRKTLQRTVVKSEDINFDNEKFELTANNGNIKMIFYPDGE